MKKRFTEEQIIGFLREAETGLPVAELCRRHGFSEASYYLWRNKFGGMSVSDAKRLKELELENSRLKPLLAISISTIAAVRIRPLTGKPRIRLTSTSRCSPQRLNPQRYHLRKPNFCPTARGRLFVEKKPGCPGLLTFI